MSINHNIFSDKSQDKNVLLFIFLIFIPLFVLILSLESALFIKLLLVSFIALFPVFLLKPLYFLVFIFLITPSIRSISQSETIAEISGLIINFNFILNFSILLFGLIHIFLNFKKILTIIKKYRFLKFFLLFILISFISIAYSINSSISLEEFSRILLLLILFLLSFISVKNKKDFKLLIFSMILGALFPALFSLFEYFSGSGWWDKTIMQYRINGTFLHPATLAFYLLFISPLLYGVLHEKQKRPIKLFLVFLLFLNLLLVALTLTRGAWIGMLVVFLTYGIIKNRKFLAFILIFLFMSYLFIPAINERTNDVFNPKYNSSFTTRLRIVTTTLPAISVSPFFGNGIGSFGQVHLDYNEEAKTYDSLQAHNDYLRLGIEVGLVGLLFYLLTFLFLFTLLIKLYLKNDKAYKYYILSLLVAWLGALAISSGDNLLRTMPVQFLLWSYTGAVLKSTNYK